MKIIESTQYFFPALAMVVALTLASCKDDEIPRKENAPEMVTTLTLNFIPLNGGSPISVTATDPDGEGVMSLEADAAIALSANTTYTLSFEIINGLAPAGSDEYYLTDEVEAEGEEHLFFYGWTNNLFSDPSGNGNIDNRSDDVGYADSDANSLPVGLQTVWTTGVAATGTFRVLLKHQPELKSETSGSTIGETDIDITFDVTVN